jgi:hypothetical protein
MHMLQRGELIPHFEVATLGGERINYATLWQRRNLMLVTLPAADSDASSRYVSELIDRIAQFRAQNTDCVMTREPVPGMPCPGALVADKWGEIIYVRAASEVADLPSAEDLSDWITYVENRCPECEGEVR